MSTRVVPAANELEALSQEVARLERRISRLEAALVAAGVEGGIPSLAAMDVEAVAPLPAPATEHQPEVQGVLALVGRTLLALGGAYLLRAVTDSGAVTPPVGIALGLAYAAVWIAAADRARGSASSIFHALAATLILLPIAWEASFRFAVLGAMSGAVTLAVFATAGLAVAARRQNEAIAWIISAGVAALAIALAIATRSYTSYTLLILGLGLASLWFGYVWNWLYLRWPLAGVGALAILGLTVRGGAGQEPFAALLLQLVFVAAYLGSFAARTLFLGRAVVPFEIVQSAVVLAFGFGGAVYVTAHTGSSIVMLGLAALALGASTYAVAFAFIERQRLVPNFLFYTSLALAFVIVGLPLSAGATGAGVGFAVLGVVAAALAGRLSYVILGVHCLAYLTAAALASGLLLRSTAALLGPIRQDFQQLDLSLWIVAGAIAVSAAWIARPAGAERRAIEPTLRAGLLALAVWCAAGLLASVAETVFAVSDGRPDAARMAAVRTVVLVAATLLLAWGRRIPRLAEAAWMIYPLLGLVAIKLVGEDLRRGRALTIMISLAAYGAALILAPRLSRRGG